MTEVELFRKVTNHAWGWLQRNVANVTDEEANWWPTGTANSIGLAYLHTVINADVEINRMLYGRIPLIERDWNGDVGQGVPYDAERFDDWPPRGALIDWPRLSSYGQAVREFILRSVEELKDEDLALPVDMTRSGLGMWDGRELWVLHGFNHVYIHGGEIICLKGL
jgi:hypothetical protein